VSRLLCLRRKLYSGHISILCHPPATTGTSPKNQASRPPVTGSPVAADDIINGRIADFQPDLETAINAFFEDNIELPLWEPVACSDTMRDHITALEIPKISPLSRFPSLLLHDLGQLPHRDLAQRVEKLFDRSYGQR
jgi:hypothetical protein